MGKYCTSIGWRWLFSFTPWPI